MSLSIEYTKILEAVIAFSSETNYNKLLSVVLTKMREITNCEAGTLYMERDDKLYFTIVQNEKLGIFTHEEDTGIPPVDLFKRTAKITRSSKMRVLTVRLIIKSLI